MLNSMAGITSRNRKHGERAAQTLKSRRRRTTRCHICERDHVRRRCAEPGAMTSTRSKIFRTLITSVTSTTPSTGASSGTVTRRKTCHSLAPSTRAASSTSRAGSPPGRRRSPPSRSRPRSTGRRTMIDGRDERRARARDTRRRRSRKFDRGEPQPVVALGEAGEDEACRSRPWWRRATTSPSWTRLDPTPGQALLGGVDHARARRRRRGVKSSQTVPRIPPSAGGPARGSGLASRRELIGRVSRTRPSADVAGREGLPRSAKACPAGASSPHPMGGRPDSSPGGRKTLDDPVARPRWRARGRGSARRPAGR